jgi:oligoribonuclease (3'-5' exoribonuclease)
LAGNRKWPTNKDHFVYRHWEPNTATEIAAKLTPTRIEEFKKSLGNLSVKFDDPEDDIQW